MSNTDLEIHRETVAGILEGERGPHIGAFFDFDGTIISGYSVYPFLLEQLFDGLLYPDDISEMVLASINFKLGLVTFEDLMEQAAAKLRGSPEKVLVTYGQAAYTNRVARMVYPESRALIAAHLEMGHTVAIVSSATPYQIEPALSGLRVKHMKCTRYVVERGHFTGVIDGEPCFGIGKVRAVDQLCAEHGCDLQKSYFYSDSDDDLAALEHVGRPQVLNPNSALNAIARRRGWSIRNFSSRGTFSIESFVRSLVAMSTFVPAAFTGAALYWLTGSKSDSRNFVISTFGDFASALMGLKLKITGEELLWKHRPALIIFNHQSNVDGLVLMKLLRGNVSAVGKKELSELPVVGPVFDFMGMIPIDRSNTDSAIRTIAPLADYMHEECRSIVMAPEGTRSHSTVPGRFKKGPFRVAMQAGVPIVPVVIHNSNDAQPKGDLFVRPATIAIDVLDPIDISDWTLEDLEERIDGVRELYLQALGLQEQPAEPAAVAQAVESGSVVQLRGKRKRESR